MTLWGRTLGVLSTAGAILLWFVFVFFNPYTGAGLDTGTMVVVFLMVMLASTGMAASLLGRPWLLLAAAVISFVPVGIYTLGVPSAFRLIGWLNLMTLGGAALLVADRRNRAA